MSKNVGERIKELREEKRITQEQLAQLSGITSNYISRIELNKQPNISLATIESIAKALNIHPSILLFGKPLAGEETPKALMDEVGPLQKDEKAFVLELRRIKSNTARKTLANVMHNFARVD